MQQDLLTITLIDFIPNRDEQTLSPTQPESLDVKYLFSLLKKKITPPESVPFSLLFEKMEIKTPPNYSSSSLKILYKYDSIIVTGRADDSSFLLVLDINTRELKMTIPIEKLSSINTFYVEESESIQQDDFIYLVSDTFCKYNLRKLLDGHASNECLIWTSEYMLNNSWEAAVFQSYIYVCGSESGLLKFDKESGVFQSMKEGYCLFGITITPENEMLSTCADGQDPRLEILTIDQSEDWTISKCKKNLNGEDVFRDPFSIFYEDSTGLIYISDCARSGIVVLRKSTLEVVKIVENVGMSYGMQIDKRNGLMYVCSGNELSLYR